MRIKNLFSAALLLVSALTSFGATDAFFGTKASVTSMHLTTNYFVLVMGDGTNALIRKVSPTQAMEIFKAIWPTMIFDTNGTAPSVAATLGTNTVSLPIASIIKSGILSSNDWLSFAAKMATDRGNATNAIFWGNTTNNLGFVSLGWIKGLNQTNTGYTVVDVLLAGSAGGTVDIGGSFQLSSVGLTPNRGLYLTAGRQVATLSATPTELNRVVGVTSDIQTQIDAMQSQVNAKVNKLAGVATNVWIFTLGNTNALQVDGPVLIGTNGPVTMGNAVNTTFLTNWMVTYQRGQLVMNDPGQSIQIVSNAFLRVSDGATINLGIGGPYTTGGRIQIGTNSYIAAIGSGSDTSEQLRYRFLGDITTSGLTLSNVIQRLWEVNTNIQAKASNAVQLVQGTNVIITASGSGGIMSYTINASAAGGGTAFGGISEIQLNRGNLFWATNNFVYTNNNLGIGTNTPRANIHIRMAGPTILLDDPAAGGGTPNLFSIRQLGLGTENTSGISNWFMYVASVNILEMTPTGLQPLSTLLRDSGRPDRLWRTNAMAYAYISNGLQLLTGANANYVLTSDANGNGTWQPLATVVPAPLAVVGTQFVADATSSIDFTNFGTLNGVGTTNVVVTNIPDGKTITLRLWPSNGCQVNLLIGSSTPPDSWFLRGSSQIIVSNAENVIEITRRGGDTNIFIKLPEFTASFDGSRIGTNWPGRTIGITNWYFRTIYVDAAAMVSNVTAGATFTTEELSAPTNRMVDSYVFGGTDSNIVQFKLAMPLEWDLGSVKVKLWTWSTNNIAATTNIWEIAASAIKTTSTITNVAWGTALEITNVVSSAGGQALLTPATPALTVGNSPAAAGNLVWFRIRRLPQRVDDNDGGQAKLLGAWVQYRESQSSLSW